ncbi:MAG: MgtC/SapB family protein [Actinobacteria bacterium]|nr:MgtC/SapB family protein [Actinomycetota bacterium]
MLTVHSIDLWQQASIIINGTIAAVLGSIIGWERDRAGKSAGPRTMALVGTAAAIVVGIGEIVDINAQYGDPTRALLAIMTGIGFLGAGLIFTDKRGGVQGVTTAATIFATAAMGVGVGLGFQVVGVGLTLIILFILRSSQFLEVTRRRRVESDEDLTGRYR